MSTIAAPQLLLLTQGMASLGKWGDWSCLVVGKKNGVWKAWQARITVMIRSQSIWALNGVGFGCTLQLRFSLMFLILTLFCMENRRGASDESVMKVVFLPAGYSCTWTDLLVSNMNQLRLLWDICSWVHHSGVVLQVEFVAFPFAPTNGSYHGMTLVLSSHC